MAKKLVAKFRVGFREEADRIYAPNCGNGYEMTYKPIMKEDGECDIIEDTKVNFYEMIQSHRAGTDLMTMIARYEHGDIDALNRTHGAFADMTMAPSSLIDFYNKLNDADTLFHRLPVEVQQKFDNNALKFWSQIDTGKVADVINEYNIGKSVSKQIDPNVVENLTPKDGDVNV